MCETSPSAPSPEVATVTQPPRPAVGDGKDEVTILSACSPAITALGASALVGCTEEDKLTRNFVEAAVVADEGANAPFSVDDAAQSRISGRTLFLVDTEGSDVILGDTSQNILPSPPLSFREAGEHHGAPQHNSHAGGVGDEEEQKADGEDGADVARGNAIQSKYSVTSEWVESFPRADSSVFLDESMQATACAEATQVLSAVLDKKRRRREDDGKDGHAKGGKGDRKRRAQEKAKAAEVQAAFKHSQRALRKQAKTLNMRDVFSRTLSLPSPLQAATDALVSPLSFPPNRLLVDTSIKSNAANDGGTSPAETGVCSPSSLRPHSPAFSPASLVSPSSPSSSSAWSPDVVGELTNRFLAHVQQQKRQKFEQMVSRELTQSQALSQTRSLAQHPREHGGAEDGQRGDDDEYNPRTRTDSAMANDFRTPVDELVIGEEDNEAANWMPADSSSPTSQHARRMMQRDPVTGNEMMLLGASSSEEGRLPSFSTTPAESRKAEEDEEASQEQDQVMRSLARKHEIWKLKQRHLRAQEQVELDERAKALQQQKSAKPLAAVTSASFSVNVPLARGDADSAPATSATEASAASAPFFTGIFRNYAAAAAGVERSGRRGGDSATAAVGCGQVATLSPDDISMIRRINSFDNTSTQRVVVFGTAASKQTRYESMQR
ncbi:conserved hypothetical protein [Leishmania major strain Friedlin]|uniref:Uncharacterized protein n=1 Tax=Leishmania major TaxID=5664 RepID=E9AF89_LEIMA|nr:conserved hypothetical protein [Leishmania major strain Friedlin]CAG9582618.1 hypothetical_protein_-_conserved [Leishmania major strain Friedlin]CBZ12893.1 conserved hypothetical protein [Leishmania major strain Friedlin]|eukprot:XP_003722659.1 conserved hypothetical protein [Leishmania major strain Friedlin]